MTQHIFNKLSGLLDGYLAVNIGQGRLYHDLMDRKCNHLNPSKVTGKCIYIGKFHKNLLDI